MKNQNDEIPLGYIRVTEVLKLYSGLDAIDPEVLAKAADRGKRVHGFCELYVRNLLIDDPDDDCRNYVDSFKDWFDSMVDDVIMIEERMNSEKYRLSGKFDLLVKLKGCDCFTLVDIKTPLAVSRTWPLQTAAYRMLLREDKGINAGRRACLMLPRTEGALPMFIEYKEHERDEALYLKALELHRFFQRN